MSVQDISNDKNYLQNSVADPDFQRRGWWGVWAVIQTLRKGGAASPKLRASVCSNNKERARGGGGGGGAPPPPPPPLLPLSWIRH